MTGKRLIAAAVLVALAQIGFLGWIIAGRAAILRDGRQVLLKVEPVDPRDLLRGDYVRLGYDISRLPADLVADMPADAAVAEGSRLTVRLKKDDDGYWRPAAAWLGTPPSPPASAEEADIAGRVAAGWQASGAATVAADYGIERFYLPEGEGRAIESDMRVRPFGVRVALGRDGTAQIKALVDGDRTLFEEPLY